MTFQLSREHHQQICDEVLEKERTIVLATVGETGIPHAVPVWFVWHEGRLYVQAVRGSMKLRHARARQPAAACADEGDEHAQLIGGRLVVRRLLGVELRGRLTLAGDDPRLPAVARLWGRRYIDGGKTLLPDSVANHEWIRLDPERVLVWDYSSD